ncbi:MAG: nodulation protein NfeD [Methanothrix sp.]|nr:nodulation protein NfeD [Methanothrix sp.]
MTPAVLRPLFSALAVLLLLQTAGCQVLAVRLEGSITPASDDIVAEAIREAERENHQALMLLLDTPGGGLTETKEILRLIEETDLPVIGYVHPEGATAWSAGTLILMGTDIASMAPHTIIGSAQPVRLSPLGEAEPINDSKTTNAIVALIAEEAKEHNRNTTAAREFVVSNLNLNADEARHYGVIEHISQSPEELLHQVDGVRTKNTTLATSGAELLYFQPPLNLQFLVLLSDPTIASLLLLVGLYALIFGLSSPGIGAEAFGVVSLALGLIGLGFNVNLGAIFLLVLGVGLILAELHSHSFGILAVAGLVCVVAGSILLVPTSYPQWYVPGGYQRSMAFALVLPSLLLGLFLAFAIYKVARVRFAPPVTGRFMGEEAEVLDRLDPEGYVLFQGEYWQARAEEPLEKGERVVIVGRDGSVLRVRRR